VAEPLAPAWRRGLLGRRRVRAPTALPAEGGFAPHATTGAAGVPVAGPRWTRDQRCDAATGAVGLEHAAVRSGTGGSRHLTRARGALALLTGRRAGGIAVEACPNSLPLPPAGPRLAAVTAGRGVPLSGQESRRRLWRLVLAVPQPAHPILAWSWRRGPPRRATYDHAQTRGAWAAGCAASWPL
jgi:hypothetical protein